METENKEIHFSSINNNIDISYNYKINHDHSTKNEFLDKYDQNNTLKISIYKDVKENHLEKLNFSHDFLIDKQSQNFRKREKTHNEQSTMKSPLQECFDDSQQIQNKSNNFKISSPKERNPNGSNIKEIKNVINSMPSLNLEKDNLSNKSLKLKEISNKDPLDLDSICNSRGEMMTSYELAEQEYFREHLCDFNYDFTNEEKKVKIKEESKRRREKFEVLANNSKIIHEKFKTKKNENEKNGKGNEENNIMMINNIHNKLTRIDKNNHISNYNGPNINIRNINEKRSPISKKPKPILNDDDFKKNFLRNNIEKLKKVSNKNLQIEKVNDNIYYDNQERESKQNTDQIDNLKPINENKIKNSKYESFKNKRELLEKIHNLNDDKNLLGKRKTKENIHENPSNKIRSYSERINIMKKQIKNEKDKFGVESENKIEDSDKDLIINDESDKLVRRILKKKNSEYIKTLNLKIKNKLIENEEKQKKEEECLRKIKENLGLANVKSKLMEPKKEIFEEVNPKDKKSKLNRINKIKIDKKKSTTPLTQETTDTLEYEELEKDAKNPSEDQKFSSSTTHIKKLKTLSKKNLNKMDKQIPKETFKIQRSEKILKTSEKDDENSEKEEKTNQKKNNEKPEKKRLDPIEIREKMQQQLEKEKIMIQERVLKLKNCYTLDDWKRRNRVESSKNVFICFNGYPDMRKALLDRGWVENIDPTSNFYDFKYALSARNIDFNSLQKNQFVNHFEKNTELTRKVALSKNLRNLIWFRNVDIHSFFPRCYDLSDINDIEDFSDDFKANRAESVLKKYLSNSEINNMDMVKSAMFVIERKLKTLNEIIDSQYFNFRFASVKEWEILKEGGESVRNSSGNYLNDKRIIKDSKNVKNLNEDQRPKSLDMKLKKKKKNFQDRKENDPIYKVKVEELLTRLKKSSPQYDINGENNIWIIKPSGLSRGRGIKCCDDLDEILNQVKSGANQFIIQKYIENPLIINKRKFDIRQWVLVTNWNPLTIYVYEEPYIRFSAEDYNPNDIKNLYSHLTNNAIAKNSDLFECSDIKGNMWEVSTFAEYLQENFKSQVYTEKIKPQIDKIITYSFESVQDVVMNRKNSHEIFGFDLMIDENFNVWLIEINSSPCMEYSTEITKKLVKSVMEDTCKVIIDKIFHKNKDADTGLWKKMYKGIKVDEINIPPGFEMVIEGSKYNPKDDLELGD